MRRGARRLRGGPLTGRQVSRREYIHQDSEPSESASEGLIAVHGPLNQSTSKLAGALSQSTPNVFVQLVHGVLRRGELGAPGIVVGYTACYLGQPVGIEFTRMPAHR